MSTKTRPGPRRGPRVPPNPMMKATEWGEMILRAYDLAHDRALEPGNNPPFKVPTAHAERLSGVIQRAYADGHSYSALARASGLSDRVLWRWAHYRRVRRRANELKQARKEGLGRKP